MVHLPSSGGGTSRAVQLPTLRATIIQTARIVRQQANSDIGGDSFTFTRPSFPATGLLSGSPPNLVYASGTNYVGLDSFTFTASDDGTNNSNLATIRIAVLPSNTANGTPYAWLILNGITNNYETTDMSDLDGDGAITWEEYLAGTIPANEASVFRILSGNDERLIGSTDVVPDDQQRCDDGFCDLSIGKPFVHPMDSSRHQSQEFRRNQHLCWFRIRCRHDLITINRKIRGNSFSRPNVGPAIGQALKPKRDTPSPGPESPSVLPPHNSQGVIYRPHLTAKRTTQNRGFDLSQEAQ